MAGRSAPPVYVHEWARVLDPARVPCRSLRLQTGAKAGRKGHRSQSASVEERSPGLCQTNLNRHAKGAGLRRSGRQLTPLGQGSRAVLLEDVAAVEVTVEIEMIVDRGVDRGEFLQGIYVPELRHRTLPSSEWLV